MSSRFTPASRRFNTFLSERRWCGQRRPGVSRSYRRASARAERHAARLDLSRV